LTYLVNKNMAMQPGGYTDRPQDDNTSHSHPSFDRGRMKGTMDALDVIRNILTEDDDGSGTINAGEIEKIRRGVFLIREALKNFIVAAAADADHSVDDSSHITGLTAPAVKALNEAKSLADSLAFKKL
tara:strand:+ start:207 stop:590 length:384 start_codon:yes stop_codon:yes gene_type:complete